jgi:thioredoxin 1
MLEVNKDNFEAEVLQASGKILVDYFGDGCAPCEALLPFIMECSEKYGDKLKFVKMNTTKARRLAISQKIMGLPVIAIYENGEKIEELVKDDATHSNITAMIEKHIA